MEEEVTQLASEIAHALDRFAARLARSGQTSLPSLARTIATAPYLGFRQKETLQLTDLASDAGMTTSDVARLTGMTQSNAHLTLKGLIHRGLVEKMDQFSPHRYRLASSYRSGMAS